MLLLLFLVTSYLTATHIHHDDKSHEDGCEVCIVIHNFHSADIPNSTINIPFIPYIYDEIKIYHSSPVTYINKGYYSTAPPSY